jgi:cytochrome c oxidase subunit 2
MSELPLFPTRASALAASVDAMLFVWLAIAGIVIAGIAIALVAFAIRYRQGSDANRAMAPEAVQQPRNRRIEIAWIVIPLAIFLTMFGWAARLFAVHAAPPRDALDVYVTGKQWMWRVEHTSGRREIDELHVPVDRPIRLVMTSEDVIHSFFLPVFRIKQDVLPGRYTTLWFSANRTGDFHVFCTQYCGTAHAQMIGRIVVMQPDAFAAWSAAGNATGTMAEAGGALFRRLGCGGCHGDNAAVHAPRLEGLFGTKIPLADGSFVAVDERYIRDAILLPEKEVAAGYAPIMPSFSGQVDEGQLAELVEYVKSLARTR